MTSSSKDDLRNEVYAIIDADLTGAETRAAVMALIPKEFHFIHHEQTMNRPRRNMLTCYAFVRNHFR